jgi:hypothetical protein
MRGLAIKLMLFLGVMEGLGRLDFMVLLTAIGVAIAVIVCTDFLLDSVRT